jgi:NAD(P)-dependent dehydrogenase (short-subunit alcohol dehydrogenase family)
VNRLTDRRAIVSGGAQGLGRAISRRLAAEGATVTVVDLNEAKGLECADLIREAGGQATFVKANIAKREAIEEAMAVGAGPEQRLDVLVNTAQYFAPPKAFELVTEKDWELSEATGPKATFRFMQIAHDALRASGRASVINFTSGSAIAGIKFTAPYSAAKGAILAITRVAANEWATQGIRVNAVCPFALTDVQRDMIGTQWDNYGRTAALSPFRRGADPDGEIAPAVAFLASDDAAFVTGTVLHIDGGMTELSAVDYSESPGVFDR